MCTMAETQRTQEDSWVGAGAAATTHRKRAVLWIIPVFLLGLTLFSFGVDLATQGRSLDAVGVLVPIVFLPVSALLAWMLTRGKLGPGPSSLRSSPTSLDFRYDDGHIISLSWRDPQFKIQVEDLYGAWDRTNPSLSTHRLWIHTPRGSDVQVTEPFLSQLIAQADSMGLKVERGAEDIKYGCPHRLISIYNAQRTH